MSRTDEEDRALVVALAKHGTPEQLQSVAAYIRKRAIFQPKKRGRKPSDLVTSDERELWTTISGRADGLSLDAACENYARGHRRTGVTGPGVKKIYKRIEKRLFRYETDANYGRHELMQPWGVLRMSGRRIILHDDDDIIR